MIKIGSWLEHYCCMCNRTFKGSDKYLHSEEIICRRCKAKRNNKNKMGCVSRKEYIEFCNIAVEKLKYYKGQNGEGN